MTKHPVPRWLRTGWRRRLFTRPVWRWQTQRAWPIRERIFELPPLPVPAVGAARLLVLSTPAGLADAAWAARSFLHQFNPPRSAAVAGPADPGPRPLSLRLQLDTLDAELLAAARARWQTLFPGSEVATSWEAVTQIETRAPAVAQLAQGSPVGRKLAVLLAAQETEPVLYADWDVLLFQPAPEIAEAIHAGGPPLYIQEGGDMNGDPRLVSHARRTGWPEPAVRTNSGLLYLPQGCFPLAEAERLLAAGAHDASSWFVEQTAVALLLARAGGQPLPDARYVVSGRGQFYFEEDEDYARLTARHFVTPVRHRMYARGLPLLWRQWTNYVGSTIG